MPLLPDHLNPEYTEGDLDFCANKAIRLSDHTANWRTALFLSLGILAGAFLGSQRSPDGIASLVWGYSDWIAIAAGLIGFMWLDTARRRNRIDRMVHEIRLAFTVAQK